MDHPGNWNGLLFASLAVPFFFSRIDLAFRAAAGLSPSATRCKGSSAALEIFSSDDFSSLPSTPKARLETSRSPLAAAFSNAGIASLPLAASLLAGRLAFLEVGRVELLDQPIDRFGGRGLGILRHGLGEPAVACSARRQPLSRLKWQPPKDWQTNELSVAT